MEQQLPTIILICAGFLIADLYLVGGIRLALKRWKFSQKRAFTRLYWGITLVLITGIFLSIFLNMGLGARAVFMLSFFLMAIGKILFLPFIVADDIRRLVIWLRQKNKKKEQPNKQPDPFAIPRSEFLMKAGLLAGSIPLGGIIYGTISGVYDYRVKHRVLYLPNLPKAFDGIRLGQISDIHSGSFFNKTAVLGGVEMLMREKTDLIFFTGDLVNSMSNEVKDYIEIFNKVKAPLGVYSCLGNHDYGDYMDWPNALAKQKNNEEIIKSHKIMGWDLLLNENRRLKVDGEEIGILGIENWGELSRFPKYGRMDLAVKNTDDLPVKLLLSHDPSHWRAQGLPEYPQIDAMFSGHTHWVQMGVRTENFQWSPIEYIYNEWAGHYQQGNQQLYVNVGYGFFEITGRVGILPEITIFELKAGTDPKHKIA